MLSIPQIWIWIVNFISSRIKWTLIRQPCFHIRFQTSFCHHAITQASTYIGLVPLFNDKSTFNVWFSFMASKIHFYTYKNFYLKQFRSIWPIDKTLSDATTLSQSWPRVMAIKRYSTFPKPLALQESHHQIVSCHIRILIRGVLPLSRDVVGLF